MKTSIFYHYSEKELRCLLERFASTLTAFLQKMRKLEHDYLISDETEFYYD